MDTFDDSLNGSDGIPGQPMTFDRRLEMQDGIQHTQELNQGEGRLEEDQPDFVMMPDNFASDQHDTQHHQGRELEVDLNRQQMADLNRLPGNLNYMHRLQNNADVSQDMMSDFGNMDAYRRSGPEGSPAFQQSSGFLPNIGSDNESSVIFRPVRQLDFSALDETGQTEEIIPHGMNRSVSTPEHEGRGISYMEREVCGSQADDENTRETSPETGFFELKSSPVHSSESEGELDSRVIFSPLNSNGGIGNMNLSTSFEPNLQGDASMTADLSHQGRGYGDLQSQSKDLINAQFYPHSRPIDNQSLSAQHHMSPGAGNSVDNRGQSVFVNVPSVSAEYSGKTNISPIDKNLERVNDSDLRQHTLGSGTQSFDDSNVKAASQTSITSAAYVFSSSLPARLQGATTMHTSPVRNQVQRSQEVSSVGSPKLIRDQHRSAENSPSRKISNPPQGLPSPSAWQIPENQQSKQNRNLFKEPKMAAPKRAAVYQVQNSKKPSIPAKNSQREVITPVMKARQEQARREANINVNRNKVQGEGVEVRPGNAGAKSGRNGSVTLPTQQQQQQQRSGTVQSAGIEDGGKRGITLDRRGTNDQQSVGVGRKNDKPLAQKNYAYYERKVEGSLQGSKSERSRTIGQVSSGERNQREKTVRGTGIGEDSNSPHTHHPGMNVVTQVQQYSWEQRPDGNLHQTNQRMQQQLLSRQEMNHGPQVGDTSMDVQGMEEVRSHLQSMLKLSSDTLSETQHYNHVDTVSGLLLEMPQEPYMYQAPMDQSASRAPEDVSELYENFPSFTSRIWTDNSNVSRSDASIHQENQRLRDALEKERYRRKHCEQHIQKLNVKLLETQQQVAVAVSTDKRKDIMIEQLDKQLAKVVEGWKKRDEEKEEYIKQVQREKDLVEENLSKQQRMIENFEHDMSQAVNEIRKEKEEALMTIQKLKTEADDHDRSYQHLEGVLQSEREKAELINQECEKLRGNNELGEKKVQQLQDRLHKEQDEWFKREQELLQRIEEVTEKNLKVIQQERTKGAELENLCKESEEKVQKSRTEIKRLEMDIDVVSREKESLKVEMGIMDDKYESAQRSLEAELHSQMQKEIASQIADVHKRMEEDEEQMRENHRRQITELGQRHSREMEKQLARYHDDLKNREDESRKIYQEYEQKLHESRSEISSLQSIKQKLESQRSEILMKLQYMMQSQWNEAVSLLSSSSPQRKKLQTPAASFLSLGGGSASHDVSQASGPSGLSSERPEVVNMSMTSNQSNLPDSSNQGDTDSGQGIPPRLNESGTFNPELSLADFSASLHIQQLLQSLSHPGLGSSFSQQNPVEPNSETPFSTASNVHNLDTVQMTNTDINRLVQPPQNSGTVVNPQAISHANNHVPKPNQEQFHLPSNQSATFQNTDRFHVHDTSNIDQRSDLSSNQNVKNWLHESTITSLPPSNKLDMGWSAHQAHQYGSSNQQQLQPTAVPIRPPQQHSSDTQIDSSFHQESQNSSLLRVPNDWSHQQPGHSPPTKQSRSRLQDDGGHHTVQNDSHGRDSIHLDGDVMEETSKLNMDYRQISDRLKEHESRQGQLQHYIQMLLQKPPGTAGEDGDLDYENNSIYSHDQTEELDLNDTAQAAQLQRELTRIQQLREKQAGSLEDKPSPQQVIQGGSTEGTKFQGILNPDQLAEISRLLSQQKETLEQSHTSQQDPEQVAELVEILKGLNTRQPQRSAGGQQVKAGKRPETKQSPRSPPQTSLREVARVKRNLKGQMTGVPDGGQPQNVTTKQPPVSQAKKVERKVAPVPGGGAKPGQGKAKSAWK